MDRIRSIEDRPLLYLSNADVAATGNLTLDHL